MIMCFEFEDTSQHLEYFPGGGAREGGLASVGITRSEDMEEGKCLQGEWPVA